MPSALYIGCKETGSLHRPCVLTSAGGFFAKDVDVLQRAAAVLLDQTMRQPTQFKRLLIARDAMAVADADAREALQQVRLLLAASCACQLSTK